MNFCKNSRKIYKVLIFAFLLLLSAVLDTEGSAQEVPDFDLGASLLSSDIEFELVPEYADLGIICDIDLEKVSRVDSFYLKH